MPSRATRAHSGRMAHVITEHLPRPRRVAPPGPARTGLRREIGFIGLLWASGGSIIGSGWLFGAQGALATAGPAAIISWVIGAVAILMLALVHAELGAMYPVAGGTARFPHYASAARSEPRSAGSRGYRRRPSRRSRSWP